MVFAIVVIGWVFSLCLHEFSHAIVAYWGGDTSVREKGYLTFNPLRYTHPMYSLVMPLVFLALGGIGLPGGAVYIEEHRLRSKGWRTAVSLAGPASSFLLAIALAAALRLAPAAGGEVWDAIAFLALLQITSVALNLLPVPPLDGYRALSPYLDPWSRRLLDQAGRWTLWALFLALWYVPVVNARFWSFVYAVADRLHIPIDWAIEGLRAFRFWVQR